MAGMTVFLCFLYFLCCFFFAVLVADLTSSFVANLFVARSFVPSSFVTSL